MTRTTMSLGMTLLLVAGLALSAGAEIQVNHPFEDPTWDEDPDLSLEESIDALKEVHDDLVDVRGLDMTRTHRTPGYRGWGLDVTIPVGGYRGFGPYARLSEPADDAWFRYYLRLDNFFPAGSGKLPGLADASSTINAKGCKPSTEADPGWSARLMFDTVGTQGAAPGEVPIGYYLYHLGQSGDCGDELLFGVGLGQDRWTCIEGRVRMNTLGSSDGLVQGWIDGEEVFSLGGLAFRRSDEPEVTVREMWNNIYFGGSYPTPGVLSLAYDQVLVSDTGRIGCIDPFSDDNGLTHEAALTELYARGLLYGCAEGLACPLDGLTRAEFAALLHRVIDTPPGSDAFVDDDGHWAEGVLDSLAAAGIMKGCDPPANVRACPNAPITRAEVAALVRRTLDLAPGPDVFGDDDGHWAEDDINALAAAGITKGCDEAGYCPDRTMIRMEAGTFTLRIDDLVSAQAPVPLAAGAEWPPIGPPPVKPVDERE